MEALSTRIVGYANPRTVKTPIKILYLFSPPRLEPLWRPGPYSVPKRSFDRRSHQDDVRPHAVLVLPAPGGKTRAKARNATMDLIVLGIGILFFALSLAYVKACDRI
ncbi:hypothetical protein EN827_13875 [Mesorhizobium sp. M1D.F.Ca.ET.184.01.1.1]|nr:hypothetical protein EN874_013875 [Mesorhizobium sp. M1D.F.Ca.ET.231.01.1.1]TGP33765.1 hypothetical protein EN877_13880 [Mesorhizobium sp. M1D.F.Ca.ET.234.01.1.1]TGS47131.1 hypothetical protein EN827_13875 [Mesorhizobium sp. M1D.F.Ca.ET.184.01.1.1]TGS62389.1 hypothetical protein EN826_013875 [Mesorhizobium sp. M1D.F.Ca.ET.183.01.1.1]TIT79155.1 MAG: hypothetical protein E5W57_08190 [Mesorhizobium sp.]